jgi:hypothetical protein
VITFVMLAFRTAWPAFAYSIEDDREAKRTYAFVLTYLLAFASWAALAPRRARAVARRAAHRAATTSAPRRASRCSPSRFAIYAGYTVLAIGSGRARRTQLNWVVTGVGAAVNIGLNFWLIPRYGMVGASISTARRLRRALHRHDDLRAERLPRALPVASRRSPRSALAVALTSLRARPHLPLAPSVAAASLVYPLALALLGFYLPAERGPPCAERPRASPR